MSKVYEYFKRYIEENDECKPVSSCCGVSPARILNVVGAVLEPKFCSRCHKHTEFLNG